MRSKQWDFWDQGQECRDSFRNPGVSVQYLGLFLSECHSGTLVIHLFVGIFWCCVSVDEPKAALNPKGPKYKTQNLNPIRWDGRCF